MKKRLLLMFLFLSFFQMLKIGFFSQRLYATPSDDRLFLDIRYLPLEEDVAEEEDFKLSRR